MDMNKFCLALLALAALVPFSASAGYQGSIDFTAGEIARHTRDIEQISDTSAACLERDLEHYHAFFRKYGISPYYGDRGAFGKLSYQGKKQYLRELGLDPRLLEQMEPMSCVELVLNCLGEGFKAAGEADLWTRLRAYTILNGVDGTSLQNGLQKLGWKILYWNPDVRMNAEWDAAEREHNPTNSDRFWGYHEEFWRTVQRQNRYLYNRVDDGRTLVNFGTRTPRFLRKVPFFVGIAHGGYHVFPGSFGNVIEAHSTKKITDPKNLESNPFNPLAGLAPTEGMYHSGLIAVPPGTRLH
jgi:hypothetical protein